MQNPTLLMKSDIRAGRVEKRRVSKAFFERTTELAGSLVAKLVRHRFGGIPELNQVASESHPQGLYPLLRCLFEPCEEEAFQLPLGDEALAGKALTLVSRSARKSRPIGHLGETAAHIANTCGLPRFFQIIGKSCPQARSKRGVPITR